MFFSSPYKAGLGLELPERLGDTQWRERKQRPTSLGDKKNRPKKYVKKGDRKP